jgi:Phage integrase, N-terminal SAM-like domain
MRDVLQTQHYAIRTENAYVDWAKRFILFHQKRHPTEMGRVEIEAFLTHLAVERHVAASTQNQALSALLFLYKAVLHQEVESVDAVRARKPKRLPTVLTKTEALQVLNAMVGVPQVMAKLLYGSGVRGLECVPRAGQRCGFCPAYPPRPGWQRRKRSDHHVAGDPGGTFTGAPGAGETTPYQRSRGGLRRGLSAVRAGAQIS